ncbi:MAG: hypothetical protein NT121_13110 [Chloroflexi bacterium]|nr:hypothetical protein [Chloroflexota bacterium]
MDWKIKFDDELQTAADARAHGNQGQARVCARRAAGIVIREYYQRREISVRTSSAYDLLMGFLEIPDLPAAARQAVEYLTLRVTEEFKLPVAVDLVMEARNLAESLLPGASQR